ncbi:hypothetical protein [Dactylosporangium darangshiense]|uniref:hypothetical protein n=1 Tax=Dactylosporangium darangshiense TaxID=579108 RepID=UPI00364160D3
MTDPASVAAAAREISALESGRGLHAVVNNAGIIVQGALELVPDEELTASSTSTSTARYA